jgi:hypothetical protein
MNAVFISLTLASHLGRGSARRRYVYHRFSSALKDISTYDIWRSAQRNLTVSDPPIYSQEGDTHV